MSDYTKAIEEFEQQDDFVNGCNAKTLGDKEPNKYLANRLRWAFDEGWSAKERAPVDMILHCPKCNFQHVDEEDVVNCQDCGHHDAEHYDTACVGTSAVMGNCRCKGFVAWLNPPHKKHRCKNPECNHVWKPANVATNGVLEL